MSYYEKYLKYKTKYLSLKNDKYGAGEWGAPKKTQTKEEIYKSGIKKTAADIHAYTGADEIIPNPLPNDSKSLKALLLTLAQKLLLLRIGKLKNHKLYKSTTIVDIDRQVEGINPINAFSVDVENEITRLNTLEQLPVEIQKLKAHTFYKFSTLADIDTPIEQIQRPGTFLFNIEDEIMRLDKLNELSVNNMFKQLNMNIDNFKSSSTQNLSNEIMRLDKLNELSVNNMFKQFVMNIDNFKSSSTQNLKKEITRLDALIQLSNHDIFKELKLVIDDFKTTDFLTINEKYNKCIKIKSIISNPNYGANKQDIASKIGLLGNSTTFDNDMLQKLYTLPNKTLDEIFNPPTIPKSKPTPNKSSSRRR